MRKFESDRAKSEEVIAKKRGLTGSEIHSRHVSEVCWELGREVPLPKTEKSADLVHYFSGVTNFFVKKSNIELETERVNVRPELAFYWGNSPVNIRV